MILNSFTLLLFSLNYSLTFCIHGISGVLSSFSHMSIQYLTNFSISGIWPTCSVPLYNLTKVLLVSFKVSIIHYSYPSFSEFLKFNLFVPKFVNPTLFMLLYLCVIRSAPPINFLSSFSRSLSSSLWLLLSSCEFFYKSHFWLLLSAV